MNKILKQGSAAILSVLLAFSAAFGLFLPASADSLSKEEISSLKMSVGGQAFGARMQTDGVIVVGTGKFVAGGENVSPASEAGVEKGDIIKKMDSVPVNSVEEVVSIVENCDGLDIKLSVMRNGKETELKLTPKIADEDGLYKAGLWIKSSSAGIGTITFINPDTLEFAGLGHGICDTETELLLPFREGTVEEVTLGELKKGEAGVPGELRGSFTGKISGSLTGNEQVGVFGVLNSLPSHCEVMPVAAASEVTEGEAEIISTLKNGEREHYKVTISEVDRSGEQTKNFRIDITDDKLINKSGGIIQGMSGSPVIQNGKLVGAVTHVLIDNPTKGYGIFVENMLNAMPKLVK